MNDSEFKLHAGLEDTHWWFRARREIIIDYFLRVLPPDPKKCVVEIGCGTGGNLRELSRYYGGMGIDVSLEAVKYAADRVDVPVKLGDFRNTPSDFQQRFDGVLLADVIEHVENDKEFLEEIIAVLKPGAIVIITAPAFRFLWSRHDTALGHYRRYRRRDFRMLWSGLGVRERFCSYFNCLLFPPIALARLLMRDDAVKDRHSSNLKPVNKVLNAVLLGIFRTEKHILRRTLLPFGVSLIAVLEKA